MRQQLKRIEATLDQLETQGFTSRYSNSFPRTSGFSRNSSLTSLLDQSSNINAESEIVEDQVTFPSFSVTAPSKTTVELGEVVQPFTVQQEQTKLPVLPRFKAPSFTSHRNGANPALAMNLLHEIETVVTSWQTELHQILRQIQDLYLEGPIVDGWLESHADGKAPIEVPPLRHADVNHLINYVNEMYNSQPPIDNQSPRTGYRLCGLNPDGQLWSRPCPPEQVPSVSLAIARYHKLRQLLNRKQYLETRLGKLAEMLIVMHGHLQ